MPMIRTSPNALPPRIEKLRKVMMNTPQTVKEIAAEMSRMSPPDHPISPKAVRTYMYEAANQYGLTIYIEGEYNAKYYMTSNDLPLTVSG